MSLPDFVERNGTGYIAFALGVSTEAVRLWRCGNAVSPKNARKLSSLAEESGIKLDFAEMVNP